MIYYYLNFHVLKIFLNYYKCYVMFLKVCLGTSD
jgi:hypothetical protein